MTEAELLLRPVLPPQVRTQIDPVTSEPVLLFPEGLLELNSTAHEIVSRCDGVATVATIIAALADEYDAPEETLAGDITACLDDLRTRNLLLLQP